MATAVAVEGEEPPVRLTTAGLGFVLAVVLLNTTSLGIVSPVLPLLVKQLVHGDVVRATEHAAVAVGIFAAAWNLMQLLFAPVFGVLSDRFGRRPVAIFAMAELSVDYVIMALAPTLGWLFVGRLFSGMAAAGRAAMFAYVADVADDKDRTRYFGLLAAAGGVGTVLGPAVGALLGTISPRAPFWAAAVVGVFNAAYGFVVLKESLPASRRTPFSWLRANPFGALWILFEAKGLILLAAIMMLANIGLSAFTAIYVLYVNYLYHWGSAQAGLVLAAYAAANIACQALLAGPAARRLGERGAIVVSFVSGLIGMGMMALAVWPAMLWLGVVAIAPVNIAIAAIQALRSRLVPAGEQGRLQGAMISLAGVAGMIGPVAVAETFAWSIGPGASFHVSGLAMFGGAGVFLLAILLSVVFLRPRGVRGTDVQDAAS